MNELTQHVIEIFTRIEAGIIEVAPDALQIVLSVVRIEGVSAIVVGLVALLISFFFMRLANHHFRKYKESYEAGDQLAGLLFTFLSSVGGLTFILTFFNVWTWVKIFSPELSIARDIIAAVIK